MTSKKRLEKISKRLRRGQWDPSYASDIDQYILRRVGPLTTLATSIHSYVREVNIRAVIGGRAKRRKSVIRKILRTPGSNIVTLADLIGVRVVVENLHDAVALRDALCDRYPVRARKEYLKAKSSGYRAMHVYIDWEETLAEVQIRTIPQQLWALESEAFGERVKEGGGDARVREYLTKLSALCEKVDEGTKPALMREVSGELGRRRGPITGRLPLLYEEFFEVYDQDIMGSVFVVVFDTWLTELLSADKFFSQEVEAARQHYAYKVDLLDDNRFDVVLLNSVSVPAMRISHANYFPSRAGI